MGIEKFENILLTYTIGQFITRPNYIFISHLLRIWNIPSDLEW